MSVKIKGQPSIEHTVTPYLVIRNAAKAIEFYKKAFGATELMCNKSPDGQSIWHARIQIGQSVIMMSDEFPEMGNSCASPETFGGTSVTLHIYVKDADAAFKKAVQAGATVAMPLENMFWGDRYGVLVDPFGHRWSIAAPIEELSPEQARQRAAQDFEA